MVDEVLLTEVAEEEGFDVTDQMEITKYLKLRVSHKALLICALDLAQSYSGHGVDQQGERYMGPTQRPGGGGGRGRTPSPASASPT